MKGSVGVSKAANKMTKTEPIGSTTPLSAPIVNERHLLLPSDFRGMEIMAPSGMFWMAMPSDSVMAAPTDMPTSPCSIPATTTPTAIPSGKLCIVTAKMSMVVRLKCARGPSGSVLPKCKWGVIWSSSNKNPMPIAKPTAAGNTCHLPMSAHCSMLGMSSDQIEAATMTPDAKPSNAF